MGENAMRTIDWIHSGVFLWIAQQCSIRGDSKWQWAQRNSKTRRSIFDEYHMRSICGRARAHVWVLARRFWSRLSQPKAVLRSIAHNMIFTMFRTVSFHFVCVLHKLNTNIHTDIAHIKNGYCSQCNLFCFVVQPAAAAVTIHRIPEISAAFVADDLPH